MQGRGGVGERVSGASGGRLGAALDVVTRCSCEIGCPACVGPVAEVGHLGKETVTRLLEHLGSGPAPVLADPEDFEGGSVGDLKDEGSPVTAATEFGPLPRGAATEDA